MKKILTTIPLIVILSLLSFLIAAPIVNNSVSKKTANELMDLPLPNDTEFIESVYKSGKLVGNGNGMQYFGAMLIKSELSLEELKEYYLNYAEHDDECVVEKQADANIAFIDHANLAFKTGIEGDDYYIVYSWGTNPTIFHEFDIRGH